MVVREAKNQRGLIRKIDNEKIKKWGRHDYDNHGCMGS